MSSKVFTGQAATAALPIDWPRVPPSAVPVWTAALLPPVGAGDAAGPAPSGQGPEAEVRVAALEKRIRESRQEGFRQGEAAGAERAAEQLEPLLKRLAATVAELAACRARYRRQAEQDVVRLSLAVARRILHREISVDPAVLAGVVKAALDQMDLRETHRLRMHPQDVPAVEPRLKDLGLPQRLELVADAGLERGAAVFETSRGETDASIGTQLAEIARGLADLAERRG